MHFFQSVDKFMNQYDWRWEDSGVIDEKGSKEVPILGMDDLIDLTDIVLQMRGDVYKRQCHDRYGFPAEDCRNSQPHQWPADHPSDPDNLPPHDRSSEYFQFPSPL